MQTDDSRIVSLFLARDESAIRETAQRYGSRLRSLAGGITGDERTAEECENDTYLEAWQRIPPHEPRDYFYAFLARITRHIALNICRARNTLRRSAVIAELDDELEQCIAAPDDTESTVESRELGEAISRFLRGCSPEKQHMFLRRYWYLDSVAEIAARCGVSESKVKSALFRARKELKDFLESEGYRL